eukprot:SAG31_NODE_1424_length_8394_cov_3.211814_5_plen_901_part_00
MPLGVGALRSIDVNANAWCDRSLPPAAKEPAPWCRPARPGVTISARGALARTTSGGADASGDQRGATRGRRTARRLKSTRSDPQNARCANRTRSPAAAAAPLACESSSVATAAVTAVPPGAGEAARGRPPEPTPTGANAAPELTTEQISAVIGALKARFQPGGGTGMTPARPKLADLGTAVLAGTGSLQHSRDAAMGSEDDDATGAGAFGGLRKLNTLKEDLAGKVAAIESYIAARTTHAAAILQAATGATSERDGFVLTPGVKECVWDVLEELAAVETAMGTVEQVVLLSAGNAATQAHLGDGNAAAHDDQRLMKAVEEVATRRTAAREKLELLNLVLDAVSDRPLPPFDMSEIEHFLSGTSEQPAPAEHEARRAATCCDDHVIITSSSRHHRRSDENVTSPRQEHLYSSDKDQDRTIKRSVQMKMAFSKLRYDLASSATCDELRKSDVQAAVGGSSNVRGTLGDIPADLQDARPRQSVSGPASTSSTTTALSTTAVENEAQTELAAVRQQLATIDMSTAKSTPCAASSDSGDSMPLPTPPSSLASPAWISEDRKPPRPASREMPSKTQHSHTALTEKVSSQNCATTPDSPWSNSKVVFDSARKELAYLLAACPEEPAVVATAAVSQAADDHVKGVHTCDAPGTPPSGIPLHHGIKAPITPLKWTAEEDDNRDNAVKVAQSATTSDIVSATTVQNDPERARTTSTETKQAKFGDKCPAEWSLHPTVGARAALAGAPSTFMEASDVDGEVARQTSTELASESENQAQHETVDDFADRNLDFEQLARELVALSPVHSSSGPASANEEYAATKQAVWAQTTMAKLGGRKKPTDAWSSQYDQLRKAAAVQEEQRRNRVGKRKPSKQQRKQQKHTDGAKARSGARGLCGTRRKPRSQPERRWKI